MATKAEKQQEIVNIWDDIDNKLLPKTFEIAFTFARDENYGDLKNVQKRLASLIEVYGPKADAVKGN